MLPSQPADITAADYCFGDSLAGFDHTGVGIRATAFGSLNVWLKAHESAGAPNDQKITLYQKSKRW